jgi:hypothetical protein
MNTNLHSINNEELRHIAPKLSAIPKLGIEESFVLPVGYFEKMHEAVLNHPFIKVRPDFIAPDLYFEKLPAVIAEHALVNKQSPFVVPENYFEKVSIKIAKRVGISEVQNSLTAPEGYFDTLPVKIQDRLYREKKEAKLFWLPQAPQYRLALVAAAIAILLVMVFYVRLFENTGSTNPQLAMNKMSESTITAGIEDINEYDESMLIDAIDQPLQIEIASNDKQQQAATAITEYLIENDITIEDIAEEI